MGALTPSPSPFIQMGGLQKKKATMNYVEVPFLVRVLIRLNFDFHDQHNSTRTETQQFWYVDVKKFLSCMSRHSKVSLFYVPILVPCWYDSCVGVGPELVYRRRCLHVHTYISSDFVEGMEPFPYVAFWACVILLQLHSQMCWSPWPFQQYAPMTFGCFHAVCFVTF